MQRAISAVAGAAAIALAAFVAAKSFSPPKPIGVRPDASDASALDASGSDGGTSEGGALLLSDLLEGTTRSDASSGARMPDGTLVPSLNGAAPKHIRIGVVLVTHADAQGAPVTARSKVEAKAVADRLAGDAQTDFKATVSHGDPGSADDVGRIPRGILEPSAEYVLFTMPVGTVSGVIDTPRGYWIAKRIE